MKVKHEGYNFPALENNQLALELNLKSESMS